MRISPLFALTASSVVSAAALDSSSLTAWHDARALPNAPDGYAPENVSCPATRPTIRSAASLSPSETEWLQRRRNETIEPLKDLLGRLNLSSFDAASYIDTHAGNVSNLPNIGIAVSGGGYRALTNGAGALKAFDSRTPNATASGHLGGLLQSATYVAGLSGGGWLVGSVFLNNFTTIGALQASDRVWEFSNSILEGPDADHFQILSTASYWKDLVEVVDDKRDAGFDVSITDYWGRALSYQLINASTDDGGPSYTWSSIALDSDFQRGQMPLPILVADGRSPGETIIGSNSTVYEFNPWEFGTFDPSIFAFAPLEYLGSSFTNGSLPTDVSCVRGFDNAGFVMGTSSSLFNQFLLQLNTTDLPSVVQDVFANILEHIDQEDNDIAAYAPNPFHGLHDGVSTAYAQTTSLDVVDGGEDGQNIPLHPLIQPARALDVIFAIDSSADTSYNWPTGISLVYTYQRSENTTGIGNGTAFPSIPDNNTFVNLGLNTHPTFFGCNASNHTGTGSGASSPPPPLIVYLPNAPYTAFSNTSTFQLSYSDEQRDEIILNAYNGVTQGNATLDENWPACVGCAILQRSAERTATTLPDICSQCFRDYCWDGSLNSTVPGSYEPTLRLADSVSSLSSATHNLAATVLAVVVAATAATFLSL